MHDCVGHVLTGWATPCCRWSTWPWVLPSIQQLLTSAVISTPFVLSATGDVIGVTSVRSRLAHLGDANTEAHGVPVGAGPAVLPLKLRVAEDHRRQSGEGEGQQWNRECNPWREETVDCAQKIPKWLVSQIPIVTQVDWETDAKALLKRCEVEPP